MKFLLDECFDLRIARPLSLEGYELARVPPGQGTDDVWVLAEAMRQDRILLTEDTDYGELVLERDLPTRGVVLVRGKGMTIDEIVKGLLELLRSGVSLVDVFTVLNRRGVRHHEVKSSS